MSPSALPDDSRLDDLFQQGVAAHRAGRLVEAEQAYRQILALDPRHAPATAYLGLLAHDVGQLEAAEGLLKRAIELQPALAEAHFHLGNLHRAQQRLSHAEDCYRAAVAVAPGYVEAHNNLGYTLARLGKPAEAEASFHAVLALEPAHEGALTNLGNLLREHGDPGAALPFLGAVVERNPDSAAAQNNLGNAYKDLGRLDEALERYRQAATLAPRSAEVHSNLGVMLQKLGDISGAVASFRRAVDLRPKSPNAYRNLLSALLFDPASTPDAIFAEHRRFGSTFARPASTAARTASWDPERRLRIGFVSSDFHDHPVARNLMPVLAELDRSKFEIFLYAAASPSDGMTTQLRGMADSWRSIAGDSDAAAADRIRADGIDILVLLAGRFDRNRPLIATYRPAPVQVSLHDPASSGLEAIDYLISDRYMTPRRSPEQFIERVLCLPHFYVHPPLAAAPPVAPAPCRRNGYVTFGSCNKPSKLNEAVLQTWAELLRRVSGSHLLLKYRNQFMSPAVRGRVASVFGAAGVDMDRVHMFGETESFASHLRTYDAIDIALDPFPFTGSTTTFEALWMGVPVVSLAGNVMAERWTGSMLHALGLDEWVAPTREQYLETAARLSHDADALETWRGTLRRRVEASPLCDGPGRARQLGRVLRAVWRRRCAQAHRG